MGIINIEGEESHHSLKGLSQAGQLIRMNIGSFFIDLPYWRMVGSFEELMSYTNIVWKSQIIFDYITYA